MEYFLVFLLCIVIGFINTLVGSGSLIMIPLLIAFGLPPQIANGTNRVAVFFQSLTGAITFFSKQKTYPRYAVWIIVPCLLSAIAGAWIATQISPKILENTIGVLLFVMLGIVMIKPERWLKTETSPHLAITWITIVTMVASGFYGGFIQGGVGIFLMASLVLGAGYSTKEANALKLLILAFYSLPVLLVFVYYNQVHWTWGLFTAVGQSIGAYIGARFTLKNSQAELWTYRVLIIVLIASVIQFWFGK
jgi:uncharacterized protein